jgi:hypothetical protein
MVVGLATDVFVAIGDNGRGLVDLDLVELGIQDVLDALVGVDAGRERATAGGFQAFFAVAAAEAQNSQAGTVGLLRMLAGIEKDLDKLSRVGSGLLRPAHEPLRRPLQVLLMSRWHVFGHGGVPPGSLDATVGSNPFVVEKDLHGRLGGTDVDRFLHELVGGAVVVLFELDVVVDIDRGFLPGGEFVGLLRKGLESRLVQFLEKLAAGAFEVFHRPGVELIEQLPDGPVQLGQAEEGVVAQAGQDPALDHLDTDFDFGFVFGLANASRDDRRTVVLSQVMVGGVEIGLVAAGVLDPDLEIVRTTISGAPPRKANMWTWALIQLNSSWLSWASA